MVENDDAEFIAEMRGEFLENVPTELEDVEACLMNFEKTGDEAQMAEFKRLVHSIKGGARMVAINDLSNFLHQFETKLQKCTQENRLKDFVRFALPFIDQVRGYVEALRDDGDVDGASQTVTRSLAAFN